MFSPFMRIVPIMEMFFYSFKHYARAVSVMAERSLFVLTIPLGLASNYSYTPVLHLVINMSNLL